MIIDQYGKEQAALFRENGPMYKFGNYMIGMYYTEKQMEQFKRLRELKKYLADSDYVALKHADGALSDEEYAEMRTLRAMWRAEINQIEEEFTEPTMTEEEAMEAIRIYEESLEEEET